jgi:hypothetical protein
MARADLRGLIGNLGDAEPSPAPTPATPPTAKTLPPFSTMRPTPEPTNSEGPRATRTASIPDRAQQQSASEGARFTDFERKETRLRTDQQNALTEHARRLNRAKGVGGQRITDNTLIRVAIDLLLSRADKLAGHDEAELRKSLGVRTEIR